MTHTGRRKRKNQKKHTKAYYKKKLRVVHLEIGPKIFKQARENHPYDTQSSVPIDHNYIVKDQVNGEIKAVFVKDAISAAIIEKVEAFFADTKNCALFEKKEDNKRGAHKGGVFGFREERVRPTHLCKAKFAAKKMPLVNELDLLLQPIAEACKKIVEKYFPEYMVAVSKCDPNLFPYAQCFAMTIVNITSDTTEHADSFDALCVVVVLNTPSGINGSLWVRQIDREFLIQKGDVLVFKSDELLHQVVNHDTNLPRSSIVFTTHKAVLKHGIL
eukprot:TRINITY_DN615_c0_g1_i2.p1 TRINITY_DN615_c0_g1~~TRINITY_DN615_c0_g1_i2.p1  ORF type:complete len:273 (+),score=34.20 TRINITY_DN615_c0_g1_i2:223-1041(+)